MTTEQFDKAKELSVKISNINSVIKSLSRVQDKGVEFRGINLYWSGENQYITTNEVDCREKLQECIDDMIDRMSRILEKSKKDLEKQFNNI